MIGLLSFLFFPEGGSSTSKSPGLRQSVPGLFFFQQSALLTYTADAFKARQHVASVKESQLTCLSLLMECYRASLRTGSSSSVGIAGIVLSGPFFSGVFDVVES